MKNKLTAKDIILLENVITDYLETYIDTVAEDIDPDEAEEYCLKVEALKRKIKNLYFKGE